MVFISLCIPCFSYSPSLQTRLRSISLCKLVSQHNIQFGSRHLEFKLWLRTHAWLWARRLKSRAQKINLYQTLEVPVTRNRCQPSFWHTMKTTSTQDYPTQESRQIWWSEHWCGLWGPACSSHWLHLSAAVGFEDANAARVYPTKSQLNTLFSSCSLFIAQSLLPTVNRNPFIH